MAKVKDILALVGAMAIGGLIVAGLGGAAQKDSAAQKDAAAEKGAGAQTVEAEQFVLKDEKGNVRGTWIASADECSLALLDADGKPAIVLVTQKDGTVAVSLRHAKSKVHAGLAVTAAGEGTVGVGQDQAGINLGVEPKGTAVLRIQDGTGQPRGQLGLDAEGAVALQFADPHGRIFFRVPQAQRGR